jgi:hypothetical protein
MFAWSQLDFSVIPLSISAVSLTGRQTWQNVNSKRRLQRIQNVSRREKTSEKETSIAAFFFVLFFVFGEKFPPADFLNDIGKNFLLGSRKKIAKCLMRTFTCRSTFLYGNSPWLKAIFGGSIYENVLPDETMSMGVGVWNIFTCSLLPLKAATMTQFQ